VDKVQQAERKLAGLCQICGLVRSERYNPRGNGYCLEDKRNLPWDNIPNRCQDKINICGTDRHNEETT